LYVAALPADVCCAARQGLPLLVFANKMDLPDALQPAELAEQMQLPQLAQRAFHIRGCSALRNEGVQEGMKWLAGQLQLG
jgi:signal recognition particle receptor subunit beta